MKKINHLISIAPMMDWTDRHCRYLMRLLTKHTLLYTEMVVAQALIHAGPERFLSYDETEHPVALQLGGCEPDILARCAKIAEQYAYDEINLNVGCPSDRVKAGRFGACLMADPILVGDCVKAMQDAVNIPITVKTRLGIDKQDDYAFLSDFIDTVSRAGCETFIIHARKAWLKGLSPKQNREVPPLDYERVYQLKKDFPHLEIIINGGIKTHAVMQEQLKHLDGVMIGREAYHNLYFLAQFDQLFFNSSEPIKSREEIVELYWRYAEPHIQQGTLKKHIFRHAQSLYHGQANAKAWRQSVMLG